MNSPFALNDQYKAAQALSAFHRLIWLDDAWTDYLTKASTIPQQDVQVLQMLNGDMRKCLIDVAQAAAWLERTAPQYQQAIDDGFVKSLDVSTLDPSQRKKLEAIVRRRGGLSALAVRAAGDIKRLVSREDKALDAKIKKIASGQFAPGDISHALRCGLYLAAAAGAIYMKNLPAAATAIAAYIKEKCLAPLLT